MSITSRCAVEYAQRYGRTIQVVDTPGIFDTNLSCENLEIEIKKCIGLSSPGPHCFLLVMQPSRFTLDEEKCINNFVKFFGNNIFRFIIILFTKKDDLDSDGITLSEYLREVPENFRNIIDKCNGRCIAFNNRDQSQTRNRQVDQLFGMINDIYRQNDDSFFSHELYRTAEIYLLRWESNILRERRNEMGRSFERSEQNEEGGQQLLHVHPRYTARRKLTENGNSRFFKGFMRVISVATLVGLLLLRVYK